MRVAAVAGTGTAVMLIALAPQLIKFLYGDSFEPAVRPLIVLAIAFIGIALAFTGAAICTALVYVRPIAAVGVAVATLSIVGQVWAAPRWGATGAATVTAVIQILNGGTMCVLAARAMRVSLPIRQLATVIAIAAVTAALTWQLRLAWPAEAIIAASVFGLGVLVLRVITTADVERVLARRVL